VTMNRGFMNHVYLFVSLAYYLSFLKHVCGDIVVMISLFYAVLRIRIRDPGSGIRDWGLFDPWIRDPGSGIGLFRIPDLGSRILDPKLIFLRA
jgi:hypothetical protein